MLVSADGFRRKSTNGEATFRALVRRTADVGGGDVSCGPAIGVGFEYAVNPTVSVALEYNYLRLSDADYQLGDSAGTYLWRIDVPDIHWIAVRLNCRFN